MCTLLISQEAPHKPTYMCSRYRIQTSELSWASVSYSTLAMHGQDTVAEAIKLECMKAVQCATSVPTFQICSYLYNLSLACSYKNLEIPAWPFFSTRQYCVGSTYHCCPLPHCSCFLCADKSTHDPRHQQGRPRFWQANKENGKVLSIECSRVTEVTSCYPVVREKKKGETITKRKRDYRVISDCAMQNFLLEVQTSLSSHLLYSSSCRYIRIQLNSSFTSTACILLSLFW